MHRNGPGRLRGSTSQRSRLLLFLPLRPSPRNHMLEEFEQIPGKCWLFRIRQCMWLYSKFEPSNKQCQSSQVLKIFLIIIKKILNYKTLKINYKPYIVISISKTHSKEIKNQRTVKWTKDFWNWGPWIRSRSRSRSLQNVVLISTNVSQIMLSVPLRWNAWK